LARLEVARSSGSPEWRSRHGALFREGAERWRKRRRGRGGRGLGFAGLRPRRFIEGRGPGRRELGRDGELSAVSVRRERGATERRKEDDAVS
jgi:hypothetical protein